MLEGSFEIFKNFSDNAAAARDQRDYHYSIYEKKRKLEDLDVSY